VEKDSKLSGKIVENGDSFSTTASLEQQAGREVCVFFVVFFCVFVGWGFGWCGLFFVFFVKELFCVCPGFLFFAFFFWFLFFSVFF